MKYVWLCSLLVFATLGAATPAAPPETLTLADLVNHPDRWPTTVIAQRDFRFTSGVVVHQGDKLRLAGFDGARALLIAPGNIRFAAPPADCGLLDAANLAWAALSPEQRAIDPDSLTADRSLWPVQIALANDITWRSRKLPAGTQVALLGASRTNVLIAWPNSSDSITLNYGDTDTIARARQLLLIAPDKRPSRMAAALAGIMVDSTGKPFRDDRLEDKKYFALYHGAGWCPPCRDFSPSFVLTLEQHLPAHPEVAAVLLNDDKTPADMIAYMQDEKMPCPAVPQDAWTKSRVLGQYIVSMMPDVVVVDRFGNLLARSDDGHGNRIDATLPLDALSKVLAAPATQP